MPALPPTAASGGALADTIAHERSLVDRDALVGRTADQARGGGALHQRFAAGSGGG